MGGAPVRIGIINDCEEPSAKMLAIAVGPPGAARVEYLSRCRRPLRGTDYSLTEWTDIEKFGVEVALTLDGVLQVEQFQESKATYRDGVPRRWQGQRQTEISLRTACIPALVRFLRTPSTLHQGAA